MSTTLSTLCIGIAIPGCKATCPDTLSHFNSLEYSLDSIVHLVLSYSSFLCLAKQICPSVQTRPLLCWCILNDVLVNIPVVSRGCANLPAKCAEGAFPLSDRTQGFCSTAFAATNRLLNTQRHLCARAISTQYVTTSDSADV